jgi:hypothetical protein
VKGLRIGLGVLGVGVLLYGALRILQNAAVTKPATLLVWLAGAVVAHDLVLVPLTTLLGLVLARTVPGRARAYLQGFLVVAAIVLGLTLVLHHREGQSQPGNALLTLDYLRTGGLVIAAVAVAAAALYAVRVLRDRTSSRRTASTATNNRNA